MAVFQRKVELSPASGVAGMLAGLNPAAMLVPNPLACADGVITGHACWYDTDGKITNTALADEAPVGFAVRVKTGDIPAAAEWTVKIDAGRSVAVLVRGDILLSSTSNVTAGQKVFANLATGAVKGAAAGASEAGFVETSFVIRDTATAGNVFHASNW